MQTMKNIKNIEEAKPIKGLEADKEELIIRKDELVNRLAIAKKGLFDLQASDLEVQKRDLSIREAEIIIDEPNPEKYQDTSEWKDYVKDLMAHRIEQAKFEKNAILEASINIKQQVNRCEENVPKIKERIAELEKSIKKAKKKS